MHTRPIALSVAGLTLATPIVTGCGDDAGTDPSALVVSLEVTPTSDTLEVGSTLRLIATLRDAGGHTVERPVTWTTSSPTIATVSQAGVVTGVGPGGPVSITASAGTKSDTAAISVVPAAVATVSLSLPETTLTVGQRTQAVAVLRDARGHELSSRVIAWSSSDSAVATVGPFGVITAVAPGGPVAIVATAEGKSDTATVTVVLAPVASVQVTLLAPTLTSGQQTQAVAVLRDANGIELAGRGVSWMSADPSVASVSDSGLVTALALGQASITAWSEGVSGDALVSVVTSDALLAAAIEAILKQLPGHIAWALAHNEDLLPRNPSLASQIEAKIAMLQRPTLADDIVAGQLYYGALAASLSGGSVPIVTVFPLDTMQTGAQDAVSYLMPALPVVESFMARPIFAERDGMIRVWYGFTMGNSGGGGTINMEDRGTYEARTSASRLPHEAILGHELAHSYFGHESLTQYLELYVYNMIHTGSPDTGSWIYTRGYAPFSVTNTGVHALLDVHQLIGWERMADAYRRIYPMFPPYGVELCEACKQVFVDEAPTELKAQVAEIVARITF